MKMFTTLFLCLSITYVADAQKIILLKDIQSSTGSSNPVFYTSFSNGTTLMMVEGASSSHLLYETKGTPPTTGIFYNKGSEKYNSVMGDGKLFYVGDDGTNGKELWISDGSSGNTKMIKDLNIADGILTGDNYNIVYYNKKAFYTGFTSSYNAEPWYTDGTDTGTHMLKNLTSGAGDPSHFTIAGSKLFFRGNTSNEGYEMWVSDGSESGTHMVTDLNPTGDGVDNVAFGVLGTWVYFRGRDNNSGWELCKTDGTGVIIVKNIRAGNGDSAPLYFYEFNGKLYFVADDGTNGRELWVTDGQTAGTNMVKDINTGSSSSFPTFMGVINNMLIIAATSAGYGTELWSVDMNDNVTMIKDINPGSGNGKINILSEYYKNIGLMPVNNSYNNVIYFAGDDGTNGRELWRTDGTNSGTYMVEDVGKIPTNSASSNLNFIQVNNNNVYLSMTDGSNGNEPYVYEATIPGPPQNVGNTKHEKSTTVYPTVNHGTFKISLGEEYFRYGYLQAVDMTGRIIYDQSIPAGQKTVNIVLSDIASGMYLVNIRLDQRAETHAINIIR